MSKCFIINLTLCVSDWWGDAFSAIAVFLSSRLVTDMFDIGRQAIMIRTYWN